MKYKPIRWFLLGRDRLRDRHTAVGWGASRDYLDECGYPSRERLARVYRWLRVRQYVIDLAEKLFPPLREMRLARHRARYQPRQR